MRSLALAGVLGLLVTATAHAGDRDVAERYFRAGAKAYAAQSFAAAAADFDEAYKAQPLPEIAFSAAQAYRRLYRVDPRPAYVKRAVELYRAYLDQVKTGGRVGDAADNLAEMQRELDKLGAAANTAAPIVAHTRLGVSISLPDQLASATTLGEIGDATGESTPRGLTAMIDGARVDPFALVEVEPKQHVIRVAADGYFPAEKTIVAVEGQASLVEIELRPRPASVAIKTEDDAQIVVDGRTLATAPTPALDLAAGTHLIAILHRGREPFSREVTVTRGQQLAVVAPLRQTGRRRAVPWLVGGASVLAAGAIVTGIAAITHDGRASDVRAQIAHGDRPPADLATYDREVASRDRYVTSTWLLGGAAIAVGTVGALLFAFDRPTTEGVRVTPLVTGTTSGAAVVGTF